MARRKASLTKRRSLPEVNVREPKSLRGLCCSGYEMVTGEPHLTQQGRERDCKRDEFIQSQGYTILRVLGYEVTRDDGNARTRIWDFVQAALSARVAHSGDI